MGSNDNFLQVLSLAYILEPVQKFNWQLLNVHGRSDLSLKSEVVKKNNQYISSANSYSI